jgi:hypothetical protein
MSFALYTSLISPRTKATMTWRIQQSQYSIYIFLNHKWTMVNQTMVFVLAGAMLLTAAIASALYASSVAAQMSNSTTAKNMTNATWLETWQGKWQVWQAAHLKRQTRQSKTLSCYFYNLAKNLPMRSLWDCYYLFGKLVLRYHLKTDI